MTQFNVFDDLLAPDFLRRGRFELTMSNPCRSTSHGAGAGPKIFGSSDLRGSGLDGAAIAADIVPGALLATGSLRGGQSVALSHGRYEQRLCTALDDLDFFHKSWKWAGLRSVVRLIRTTCRGAKLAAHPGALGGGELSPRAGPDLR